ncbi:hypothetical protein ACFLYT_01420, partial [Nanoarchaeota archaeon]
CNCVKRDKDDDEDDDIPDPGFGEPGEVKPGRGEGDGKDDEGGVMPSDPSEEKDNEDDPIIGGDKGEDEGDDDGCDDNLNCNDDSLCTFDVCVEGTCVNSIEIGKKFTDGENFYYCDPFGETRIQTETGFPCTADFECETSICKEGLCAEPGFVEGVGIWLDNLVAKEPSASEVSADIGPDGVAELVGDVAVDTPEEDTGIVDAMADWFGGWFK